MNSGKFDKKNILVTGGTRGIGLEISKAFSLEGAKVAMLYRSRKERADQALSELSGRGHQVMECDVSNPEDIAEVFKKIRSIWDTLDIVVNNAGIGFHHPIDTSNYENWQLGWKNILNVNLIGPANVCYQAAQIMIAQKHGHIINVSSRGAFRGEPEQPAYGASKAGLNSLTQSLAYRLAPHNIFVGAVAPGFVETEMAHERLKGIPGDLIKAQSPMNRVAQPSEVAQAVLLMASANQWMTGGIFDVNGASYFRT